jgi:hypothetical protein
MDLMVTGTDRRNEMGNREFEVKLVQRVMRMVSERDRALSERNLAWLVTAGLSRLAEDSYDKALGDRMDDLRSELVVHYELRDDQEGY